MALLDASFSGMYDIVLLSARSFLAGMYNFVFYYRHSLKRLVDYYGLFQVQAVSNPRLVMATFTILPPVNPQSGRR